MDYRGIFKEINEGRWQGLYLLFGEENYIKEQALEQAIEAMVEPSFMDLNYAQMDGAEIDLGDIVSACETLPFMGPKRVVVIKDLPLLYGKTGGDIDEDGFIEYAKTMSETTCLILYCRNDVDKRRKLYRHIKKTGKALEFKGLRGRELNTWINQTLKRHGKGMSHEAQDYLIDRIGNNLEDLLSELNKLVHYVGEGRDIDIEAIDRVTVPTLEQSIFQLVDAIGEKRADEALKVLGDLLYAENQAVQPILAMIARQFRLILQCKGYRQEGYSADAIAAKLKQRSFVVGKCLSQGRNFTMEELREGLLTCLEVDYDIKMGKMEGNLGLELIIFRMCGIENKKSFHY